MRVKLLYKLIFKYKAAKYFLPAIFFILAALFVSWVDSARTSKEYLTAGIRESIVNEEKNLDHLIGSLAASLNDSVTFTDINLCIGKLKTDEKIFTLFIFRDDSLIYWSNNQVPVDDFLNEHNYDKPFLKISNGWFDIRELNTGVFHIIGLLRIKYDYPYQNDHIRNQFVSIIKVPEKTKISTEKGRFNITNSDGEFLFSFEFSDQKQNSAFKIILITLFYFLAYIFLIVWIYTVYQNLNFNSRYRFLLLIAFIVDIVILRYLTFYFQIPRVLYGSPLFSPSYFAVSTLFPSLGDLLANLILIIAIAFAFHDSIRLPTDNSEYSERVKLISSSLILIGCYVLFQLLIITLDSIVINSSVSFNLSNISQIGIYSVLGFLSMGLIFLIYFFLTFKSLLFLSRQFKRTNRYLYFIVPALALLFLINFLAGYRWLTFLIFAIYVISYKIITTSHSVGLRFTSTLFYIFLFSILTTITLYYSNGKKEMDNRKLIAGQLAEQRDPIAEFSYQSAVEALKQDSLFKLLPDVYFRETPEDSPDPADYFLMHYFKGFQGKFDVLITICDSTKTLNLQPDDYVVGCYDYFQDQIDQYGHPTQVDSLYFIDYEFADDNYLGLINIPDSESPLKIFIEIFPKNVPKAIGYPELLIDKNEKEPVNWSQYSYARYENGELVYRYGKYYFSIYLDSYLKEVDDKGFFNKNGYNHLLVQVSEDSAIILSIENPGFLEYAAPFSYVFIFYGLLAFLVFLFLRTPIHIRLSTMGLKGRIQLSITVLIVVSFLFVGAASLFYIISLNNDKNFTILSEKTHSTLVELEHKLAEEEALTPDMESYLSELLYKFSLVFFTDLNLYDLNGTLLATSRPEIFNKGLISAKMNPQAYSELTGYKKSLLIHKENIGDYEYLSAYIPFRNVDNKVIAYLNLPYFARQDELTNEISTFLVAYINIYVILIALAIFTILIISNYITKPIQMLREKLSRLKLGKTGEKISWSKNDEIGSLVQEYNRKVEELAVSAEMLAKSERESAWREMARQIAHEIKNPLTPMKLSVQYLQKAWDEKAPDWDERLKRFTQTLTEQIDSLSIIASEFSDFAKMPRSRFQVTDLSEIISNAISLYKDTSVVKFVFEPRQALVWADKEQLLRVFNNLIKNSIQAISKPEIGVIEIKIESAEDSHIITFRDNGNGIPEDQKPKVFYPNFTTKSGGMGLGLAMVKSIIENAKGSITFESRIGEGTVFTIILPVWQEA